jgi:enolase
VVFDNGIVEIASLPSGASTGEHEAVDLRDGEARYGGKGVRKAVGNVNDAIAGEIKGLDPTHQAGIDSLLLDLDGAPNKAKLGANAILGVSTPIARAAAKASSLPLYAYLGGAARDVSPCL